MSKLVERLRAGPLKDGEGVNNDDQAWDWWCDITDAAADTIEAQSKLIEELREAVRDLSRNQPRNVWPMHPSIIDNLLSKANPHSEKVE